MSVTRIDLEDKYRLSETSVYLTGTQALTRLPMLQQQRDRAQGANTAGFISGYRGSPLGQLDKSLWAAKDYLEQHQIHFQPGVNEELAATAVWGSQQTQLFPGARYDGVFALWYGKGPGVDRCGDVFKHGNSAGVSPLGGVLLLAGDDHGCKSSTLAHQSEHAFIAASIPVLNPSSVQELLDYGIIGWALSRYSGCWVALKTIAENVDSSAVVEVDPLRVPLRLPEDFTLPEGGVHIRWPDPPLIQEARLNTYKIYAARAFARVNQLNRVMLDTPNPRLGIITTGKSYLDVRQALEELGLDAQLCAQVGLRVFKVGMSWPLEPVSVHQFAEGVDEILVVEEKRSIIEDQLTGQLYNWPVGKRPVVVGEFDELGASLLPNVNELTPSMIARVIASRLAPFYTSTVIVERLAFLARKEAALANPKHHTQRTPHFCSGCPHNSSTQLPDGSRGQGGIGCHYMTQWMDRNTDTFTQMGGEGATWIGQAPFTDTAHVFQNLGDGTYFHSGQLALRAALAAGVNITYKILYNGAVAMTGGQPLDGELSVEQLTQQVFSEGVKRIAVVSDDLDKYIKRGAFAAITSFHHRRELDAVQRELREFKGVSVLIYDQTCATQKRRLRKRGQLPDPAKRVFINPQVCEGCGDCGVKSNCLSVLPLETELGRKRQIDQHACNKDFSCLEGFCPSFVSVHGGALKAPQPLTLPGVFTDLPEPQLPSLERPWNILMAGVGGTGITTLGAVLGMAAHIQGKGCSVLDQAGLAQKFGPVVAHIRIAAKQNDIYAVRIAAGEADVLLGCDLVVAASDDVLAKLSDKDTCGVINSHLASTAEFTRNPDAEVPSEALSLALEEALNADNSYFVDAQFFTTQLLGDSIFSNLFMLGFAYQKGWVPVAAQAINQAIALNTVEVELNQQAFLWGRRAAYDHAALERLLGRGRMRIGVPRAPSINELMVDRAERLTAYQNTRYALRYTRLLALVMAVDFQADKALSQAVARNYFKVLAYKDEYEVARLFTDGEFKRQLSEQFSGDYRISFHFAPSWLANAKTALGQRAKREFGPWMFTPLAILARLKWLRGTPFDVFGYSLEHRQEREFIALYEAWVVELVAHLTAHNYSSAVALAELPEQVRGYGPIKQRAILQAKQQALQLMGCFRDSAVIAVSAQIST